VYEEFQEENDDVREHDKEYEYIYERGRDLGMERTRRSRESPRKIFERGARSGSKKCYSSEVFA
jgi:CRISPR/Cas system-associated protein Cas5 (RAMP superfamily)